ncbi:MAG: flagellar hook-associated protein FlgK [Selenomonadaceae bacterium]|uniref:flagellar hook-associated protein FlgK n=1 Tax=Anaerovibrio slackiae TaxID=2652309 RepID=UPI00386B1C1C|nr:flagellar hook-associated protein FlgK [Selenomonadaceae bacterium]MBR0358540.1 flagellar hook-associated protein FlgK [Selenomonadaceae bacterium]
MQSTFSGLNTMVNGIYTNRLGLNTVGHNISNSNTEGYSRQTAHAAATPSSEVYTLAGASQVGNGSTVTSVIRARDIYADRQYWKENSTNGYYNGKANNYAKIESIFNDSKNTGIQNAMEKFYQAWEDCSTTASSDTSRQNVINAGQNFAQTLQIAANQVQEQINSLYDDITLSVETMNRLLGQVVELNKNISGIEANGANANDLRDQRDLIVDQLTEMTNITVYETSNGMYTLVSNGTTLVNGITKVDLEMSAPKNNKEYGLNDYDIIIKQTGTIYSPGGGELKAQFEAIAEDKGYIDEVARMATFLLTTLNDQHKAGYGIDGNKDKPFGNANPDDDATTGLNFYGESDYEFTWTEADGLVVKNTTTNTEEKMSGIQIVDLLVVNGELTAVDGHKKLATRSGERASDMGTIFYETTTAGIYTTDENDANIKKVGGKAVEADLGDKLVYTANSGARYTTDAALADKAASGYPIPVDVNGTGDGSNAVWMATLLNCENDKTSPEVRDSVRAIGKGSLYSYYNTSMTTMGSAASNMNGRVDFQSNVMSQVENLRSSTNGVNWDEELTNMIMFQQGYSACSRCLNAMDECLDKLINGTGTVGR